MKLSAARYLLVEIEDGVKGKIPRHQNILIYQAFYCCRKGVENNHFQLDSEPLWPLFIYLKLGERTEMKYYGVKILGNIN